MNFENVSEAILIVFDALENDEQSSELLDLIDFGEDDLQIERGLKDAIARLKEIGKNEIAEQVSNLLI